MPDSSRRGAVSRNVLHKRHLEVIRRRTRRILLDSADGAKAVCKDDLVILGLAGSPPQHRSTLQLTSCSARPDSSQTVPTWLPSARKPHSPARATQVAPRAGASTRTLVLTSLARRDA